MVSLIWTGVFFLNLDTLTGRVEEAKQLVFVFNLLVAGLAFGGGYALLLALPFYFIHLALLRTI